MATKDNMHREFLSSFQDGMDNDTNPLLLQRTQLSYAENLTNRGAFIHPRPPHTRIALSFSGIAPNLFQNKLFQAAAYYQSDYGPEYLMAMIGGRLFKIQVAVNSATVTEIPITGEASPANPADIPQCWMWQAEKWMIIQNGQSLPIFYDGVTARRSVGSVVRTVGTVDAPGFTITAIGTAFNVTLKANYTDQFNLLVGAYGPGGLPFYGLFQTLQANTSTPYYTAILTNVDDTPAGTIPAGTQIIVPATAGTPGDPGSTGHLGTSPIALHIPTGGGNPPTFAVGLSNPAPLGIQGYVVGQSFYFANDPTSFFNFVTVQSQSFTARSTFANTAFTVPVGTEIITVQNGGAAYPEIPPTAGIPPTPAYPVATTTDPYTVPAVGANVTVKIGQAYTGVDGLAVTVLSKNYLIHPSATVGPSTTLTLVNLSDDGSSGSSLPENTTLRTLPEFPAGRMGAYGLGRNVISLTDGKSFIISDIVGGPSGTSAYQFRDAVLRITENNFLVGGGKFAIPGGQGEIKAILFVSLLDKSLGQGPVQIFTPTSVFSCIAPTVEDRTTWATITNPILAQSLIGSGGLGQDSTFNANGDSLFRSLYGFGSLTLARREFASWGNVPISQEVSPIISSDNLAIVQFGSGLVFDNRALMTIAPKQTLLGVVFQNLVALNFDPLSGLRGKLPSVYDGIWSGLNVLKLVKGQFTGNERLFAFCLDSTLTEIQLFEQLLTATTVIDDDGFPIVSEWQSPSLFNRDTDPTQRQYLKLEYGEIYVDNLIGKVIFETFYKPDQYPGWVPWHTWQESQIPGSQPEFRPRMAIGVPSPNNCDPTTGRPLVNAYTYQVRLRMTGQCTFKGMQLAASDCPEPKWLTPNCGPVEFPPAPVPVPGVPGIVWSSTIPIIINDGTTATPYPPTAGAVINVTSSITISKVILNLIGLSHPKPNNLDIVLVSPGNSAVWILSAKAGNANTATNVNLTIDPALDPTNPGNPNQGFNFVYPGLNQAVLLSGIYGFGPVVLPHAPPTGITIPIAPTMLEYSGISNNTTGQNSLGVWSLYVYDAVGGAGNGIIAGGWSLTIT